jgi:predicted nucleic acid-binding protein
MILADTSVWIEHQRGFTAPLDELLARQVVVMHPWVIGELACGSLANRRNFIDVLVTMPQILVSTDLHVLFFVEQHRLFGRGIGYTDMHLLAACMQAGARLWTRDKRLAQAALDLNIAYFPQP